MSSNITPEDFLCQILQVKDNGLGGEPLITLQQNKATPLHKTNWHLKWHSYSPKHRQTQFLDRLPKRIGFYTSGHTKEPVLWLRSLEQLLAEVEILSEICLVNEIDGIISFTPAHHLYGFLLTFLLPAVKGLPIWSINSFCSLHSSVCKRPLLITIPSALTYLERRIGDLDQYDTVTIVHSTALLPATGLQLVERLKAKQINFIELFGSTETGLIATRAIDAINKTPWQLARDVAFVDPYPQIGQCPLEIYTPRLAATFDRQQLLSWQLDDLVRILTPRRFKFIGRQSRLIKKNGQRINLDSVEDKIRQAIPYWDFACVPVRDSIRSENFDLLMVSHPEYPISVSEIRLKCSKVLTEAEQPRKVLLVPQLERSVAGKLLLRQEFAA
jgi:acyl-coenzyme A synthetase/AMP-(fatty) acid ligase